MAPSVRPAESPPDAAARAKRRLQRGESFHRRIGAEELVAVGDLPAVVGEHRHGDDGLAHHTVLPRRGRLLMRRDRERVGTLLRDLREAVMEVLGCLAHRRRRLVDQALRDEARIEVDVLAHRVVAHVLDAAGDGDVHRAERDLAGRGSHRRERACAHPVDREAGHRLGNAREQCDVAAECQALVADLCGRGEHNVADAVGRDPGVPAEQLADSLDGHVVCACAPVTGPSGLPSRRACGRRRRRGPLAAHAARGPR